uniref:Uncharacterized protein n=1 Tax=Anopheles dirus TaxID=7168 RepID=A0A182NJM3_9DIPT
MRHAGPSFMCRKSNLNYVCIFHDVAITRETPTVYFGYADVTMNNQSKIEFRNSRMRLLPVELLNAFRQVERLDLNDLQIEEIFPSAFQHGGSIKELDLSFNYIQSLPPDVFNHLKSLERLVMDRNNLSSLSYSTFSGTANLKVLSMSNNNLERIQDGTFNRTTSLGYLNLTSNKLNHIDLSRILNLSEANVSFNQLTVLSVPGAVENLDASHNHIRSVLGQNNVHLTRLNMGHNNLTDIDWLVNFPGLKELDLSHNKLEEISAKHLNKAHNLNILRLQHNRLWRLGLPRKLTNLRALDVSHNSLVYVENNRQQFGILEELYLGHNSIVTIKIASNNNLQNLTMSNNDWDCRNLRNNIYLLEKISDADHSCQEGYALLGSLCCKETEKPYLDRLNQQNMKIPEPILPIRRCLIIPCTPIPFRPFHSPRYNQTEILELENENKNLRHAVEQRNQLFLGLYNEIDANMRRFRVPKEGLVAESVTLSKMFKYLAVRHEYKQKESKERRLEANGKQKVTVALEKLVTTLQQEVDGLRVQLRKVKLKQARLKTEGGSEKSSKRHPGPSFMCRESNQNYDCIFHDVAITRETPTVNFGYRDMTMNNQTKIAFRNSHMRLLPVELLNAFRQVERLDLSALRMEEILPSAFLHGGLIKELDLSSNEIQYLSANVFYHLKSLEILIMDRNKLSTLVIGIFARTPNLKMLSMSNNNLERIEDGTFNWTKSLGYLNLASNKLTHIDLSLIPSLFAAIVRRNQLTVLSVPAEIETLEASHNQIRSVSVQDNEQLTRLNLSHNNLTRITWLIYFPALRILDLSHNELEVILVRHLINAHNLTILLLQHNRLMRLSLPRTLPKLRVLDVSHNSLVYVENNQQQFGTLEELYLDHNSIVSIKLFSNNTLQNLTMSHNDWDCKNLREYSYLMRKVNDVDLNCNAVIQWNSLCCKETDNPYLDRLNEQIRATSYAEMIQRAEGRCTASSALSDALSFAKTSEAELIAYQSQQTDISRLEKENLQLKNVVQRNNMIFLGLHDEIDANIRRYRVSKEGLVAPSVNLIKVFKHLAVRHEFKQKESKDRLLEAKGKLNSTVGLEKSLTTLQQEVDSLRVRVTEVKLKQAEIRHHPFMCRQNGDACRFHNAAYTRENLPVYYNFVDVPRNSQANIVFYNSYMRVLRAELLRFHKGEQLSLNDLQIETIEPTAFQHGGAIKELNLSFNYIQSLPPDVFNHLKSLERLIMNRNNLSSLSYTTFAGTPNLKVLSMSNNNLERIEDGTFNRTTSLGYLNLTSNKLNHIDLSRILSLSEANVSFNQLTVLSVPGAVEKLDASHNHIRSVLGQNNVHLTRLNLGHNNLTDIDWLVNFPGLKELDLSHNKLEEISAKYMIDAHNMTILLLQHNRLMRLNLPRTLTKLRALDVSHNSLVLVENNQQQLGSLEQLYLDHNSIVMMRIVSNNNLKNLTMSNNDWDCRNLRNNIYLLEKISDADHSCQEGYALLCSLCCKETEKPYLDRVKQQIRITTNEEKLCRAEGLRSAANAIETVQTPTSSAEQIGQQLPNEHDRTEMSRLESENHNLNSTVQQINQLFLGLHNEIDANIRRYSVPKEGLVAPSVNLRKVFKHLSARHEFKQKESKERRLEAIGKQKAAVGLEKSFTTLQREVDGLRVQLRGVQQQQAEIRSRITQVARNRLRNTRDD